MADKGIILKIGTEFDAKDLKKAKAEIARLERQVQSSRTGFSKFGSQVGGEFSKLGNTIKGNLATAIAGAGMAIAGLATAMAIDGVKSAMEEEQAVRRLATALNNVGAGAATEQVLGFVDSTQRATGVADDKLYPALQRIIQATGDVTQSQKLLNLALDISAAGYGDVETIARALSKASLGNATALNRLGVPLSANARKAGNFSVAVAELSKQFDGYATGAADTFAGRIARLSVAFDELKESFGQGFLAGLSGASGATDDVMSSLQDMQPAVESTGRMIGTFVNTIGEMTIALDGMLAKITAAGDAIPGLGWMFDMWRGVSMPLDFLFTWGESSNDAAKATDNLRLSSIEVTTALTAMAGGGALAVANIDDLADSMKELQDQATGGLSTQITFNKALGGMVEAVRDLKPPLNAAGDGFDILSKAGQDATSALISVADEASNSAQALIGQGQYEQAAQNLLTARSAIADTAMQLGMGSAAAQAFAASLVSIPKELSTLINMDVQVRLRPANWVGASGVPTAALAEQQSVAQQADSAWKSIRDSFMAAFSAASSSSGGGGGGGGGGGAPEMTPWESFVAGLEEGAAKAKARARLISRGLPKELADAIVGQEGFQGITDRLLKSGRDAVRKFIDLWLRSAEGKDSVKSAVDALIEKAQAGIDKLKEKSKAFAEVQREFLRNAMDFGKVSTFRPAEGVPISVEGITANLRQRLSLTRQFFTALKGLQALNLGQSTLLDILRLGPSEGLPYAQAILAGGKAAVDEINTLTAAYRAPSAGGGLSNLGAELVTGGPKPSADYSVNVAAGGVQITVNGEITAQTRKEIEQAVVKAFRDVGREARTKSKAGVRG